jgi:hypothetical protein
MKEDTASGRETKQSVGSLLVDLWPTAFSKESLSIAADNYEESLSFVKRNVREKIKLEKVAA